MKTTKKCLFILVPVAQKILVQNLVFRPLACASFRITSLLITDCSCILRLMLSCLIYNVLLTVRVSVVHVVVDCISQVCFRYICSLFDVDYIKIININEISLSMLNLFTFRVVKGMFFLNL